MAAPRGDVPALPEKVTGRELEPAIINELRSLGPVMSVEVARRLVMVARLVDEQPEQAWAHAREALRLAGRVAVVREAAGLAAYHAGEFAHALRELRTHRRMTGSVQHWPVMADCELGLGRPQRALTMAGAPEVGRLDTAERVEMRIVAAGARSDLGQHDAAIVTLQGPELKSRSKESWSARIKYAYADALLAAGHTDQAREWFTKAVIADPDGVTDALERIDELDGIGLFSHEDD